MLLPWTPESPISLYNIARISGNIASDATVLDSHPEIRLTLVQEPATRRRAAITGVEQPTVEDRIAAIDRTRNPHSRVEFADLRLYLLPGLWLTGALLMLGTVYISNRRFLARVYKNRPVIDERILETLESCKEAMGVHHPILIYPTKGTEGPALLGFVRPRILVPEEMLASMSLSDIRCVLLHELAHIKRKDILINWLSTALLALHWFNPVIWFAFRRLHSDRESACDALALRCSHLTKAKNTAVPSCVSLSGLPNPDCTQASREFLRMAVN